MVVPHVAIVSNFTLTGSGSCIWDLVNLDNMPKHYRIDAQFSKRRGAWQRLKGHFGFSEIDNSRTVYRTAWQWDRGHRRMEWLESYIKEYPDLAIDLRRKLHVGYVETICFIWVPALAMLLVPCALGCLIRYGVLKSQMERFSQKSSATTPTVGISCKSIIPLLYSGAQVGLMLLWQFDISLTANRFKGPTWLARLLKGLFMFLTVLSGFVAIGGTSMTTLRYATRRIANISAVAVDTGMTNNCLCYIPVSVCIRTHASPY